jgi:hypothetical protein
MYSFAERSDTRVYDEPLYAHYLRSTDADEYHPGAAEVLASMENDGRKVVEMMLGPHDTEVVFFKQMTHHLVDLDPGFLEKTINVILTRDPREMIPSIAKVIKRPQPRDLGYEAHLRLLEEMERIGQNPIVLDSKYILMDPRSVLSKFCERVGIPFEENMLQWEAGPRPEDGVWAKYWYANVHESNGFLPYAPKLEPVPQDLLQLLTDSGSIYERLSQWAIK